MNKIICYLKYPNKAFERIIINMGRWLPSKFYIGCIYRLRFHRKLNWKQPQSFNEKLNWIKINDHNPLYTRLADKYAVKEYVASRIGESYVVENYLVVDRWEDIDFSKLPNQFVIKGTHDSGGAFVCRNKATFDYESAHKKVENNQKRSWYWHLREWPYKNIQPRIIVDKYLDDGTGKELRDYKWWCFGGKPTFMYLTIKGKNVYENFYDMNFEPVAIDHGFPRHYPEFEKPSQFELMKKLAAKLSLGIPFVRVDFFQVGEKVYFGEFTFYDWGGMRPFANYEQDMELGNLIDIPEGR